MEIALIRHFPTQGNLAKHYIGRLDEPLVSGFSIVHTYPPAETVIASPMKRCTQTAGVIYPGLPIRLQDDLRECDFGLFEGKSYEELKEHPDYQNWLKEGGMIPFPQGEDPNEFKKRCIRGFQETVETLIGEECTKAAIVVHGGTIMAVLEHFARPVQSFYHWQAENGGGYTGTIDAKSWQQGEKEIVRIQKL